MIMIYSWLFLSFGLGRHFQLPTGYGANMLLHAHNVRR